MQQVHRKPCWIHRMLIYLLAVLIPVAVITALVSRALANSVETINKNIPDNFPVLVLTYTNKSSEYDARIVFNWALDRYLKDNPKHSFLVPPGQLDTVNKKLKRQIKAILTDYSNNRKQFGAGEVAALRSLPGGRQHLKVRGTWDDDRENVGWYVAGPSSFTLERYQVFFGPGLCIMVVMLGGPMLLVSLVIASVIDRILCKRATSPEPT